MKSALAGVSSVDSLYRAWRRLYERSTPRSRKSCGTDDESLLDFDKNPTAGCREIARQMRGSGGYQFATLRAVPVPKGNDKDRIICVPTVRDRIVQRSIVNFLAAGDRCRLANNVSFGFIQGRSVEDAVKEAQALRRLKRWVYKTDITAFFDSIDRDVLREKITHHVRDRSLHQVLISAANCELAPTSRAKEKRIKAAGIQVGKGVRQGMPLSPFFANLLLKNFDESIQNANISMVRYADDLICFCETNDACSAVHDLVGAALLKEGLAVPPVEPQSKSQIYGPDDPAEFLGLQLRPQNGSYILEVSAKQTEKIRQRILLFADLDSLNRQAITFTSFVRRLDGLLAGYSGAYEFAGNAKHLDVVLESASKEALSRLLSNALEVDVNRLAPAKRQFLGIPVDTS